MLDGRVKGRECERDMLCGEHARMRRRLAASLAMIGSIVAAKSQVVIMMIGRIGR